jgi:hypothetical protein
MGERSAVRPKSGQSVSQSDPGLRRPTPPTTAGRKPAARPPVQFLPTTSNHDSRVVNFSQHKTVRGAGQSPALFTQRAALVARPQSTESQVSPYSPSTSLKSERWSISSRWIGGTGKHMVSDPCSPSAVPRLVLRAAAHAHLISPRKPSNQTNRRSFAEGVLCLSCLSPSIYLLAVSTLRQSATIALVKTLSCALPAQCKAFSTSSADTLEECTVGVRPPVTIDQIHDSFRQSTAHQLSHASQRVSYLHPTYDEFEPASRGLAVGRLEEGA